MSTVEEIKSSIERLDDQSLRELANWFEDYLGQTCNQHLEGHVHAGKLDKLGEAADRAFEEGKCRPL